MVLHIHDHDRVIRRQEILLKGLSLLGIPLLVTEQYPKGLGNTIPSLTPYIERALPVIEKTSFSCHGSTTFEARLMGLSRHHMVIVGVESHICILQTVLDSIERGNLTFVVEDGIGSRNPNEKYVALRRMHAAGAIITSVESVLFDLCQSSQHPAFKEISALVK